MKRFAILFSTFALCSSLLSAQTSIDDALTLQEGNNSYTSTTSAETFWHYTSPDTAATVLCISPVNSSSLGYYLADGTKPSASKVRVTIGTDNYVLVGPGESAYISAKGGYDHSTGTYNPGFDASLDVDINHAAGFYSTMPIEVTEGRYYMVSNGTAQTTSVTLERYFYYYPTATGTLTINVGGGSSTVKYVSRNSTEFTTVTGGSVSGGLYPYTLPVNEGEEIIFTVDGKVGNARVVTVSLQAAGEGGDGSRPSSAFTVTDGEVEVPAHFGEYWYRYDAQQTGFVIISGSASIPGGQVRYYGSSTTEPQYTSDQGSWGLRFAVTQGMSYYFTVNKVESTSDATPFHLETTPPAAGDNYTDPIIIGSGTYTLPPYGNQIYYYAVQLDHPGEEKLLTVHATSADGINDQTTLWVYPYGNMGYGSGQIQGGADIAEGSVLNAGYDLAPGNVMTGENPGRYIIRWEKYENRSFSFEVKVEEIAAGDALSNPLPAHLGINELDNKPVQFYSYTATRDCKLTIALDDPQLSITFPAGTGPYDGSYTPVQNGLTYWIDAKAGQTYYLCIEGMDLYGYTFTLSEVDYAKGETASSPIDVTGDVVTFTAQETNLWYRWVAGSDGVLTLSSDIQNDDNATIGYVLNWDGSSTPTESSIVGSVTESTEHTYHAEIPVQRGDEILVHVHTYTSQQGRQLTFSIRSYVEGETQALAYTLPTDGSSIRVRQATRLLPTYVRIPLLAEGVLTVSANPQPVGTLYADDALTQPLGSFSGDTYHMEESLETDFFDITTTVSDLEAQTSGLWLVIASSGGEVTLFSHLAEGSAITQIGADASLSPSAATLGCYDLLGRRLSHPATTLDDPSCPSSSDSAAPLFIHNGKIILQHQ